MKYFILAKFLKHLNLRICNYWCILCCEEQTDTHNKSATNVKPVQIPKLGF